MTKGDFELISGVIRYSKLDEIAREHIANEFARVLKASNPRFDDGRFLRACEREGWEAERA